MIITIERAHRIQVQRLRNITFLQKVDFLTLAILAKWIIYLYISFDAKFNADSEFEVEKLCLSTHLRENRVLKNLRRRIQKFLCALNSHSNFSSKYVHMLILALSVFLESPTFKKSTFRNYVIFRHRGIIKLQWAEQGQILDLMSKSDCVDHLAYLRYYAIKF